MTPVSLNKPAGSSGLVVANTVACAGVVGAAATPGVGAASLPACAVVGRYAATAEKWVSGALSSTGTVSSADGAIQRSDGSVCWGRERRGSTDQAIAVRDPARAKGFNAANTPRCS